MATRTEEEWIARFGDALENSEGSTFFETYGDDWAVVQAADEKTVWSIIESDENQYLVPGFHFVNRIGYVLSVAPITQEELDSGEWDEILWVDGNELDSEGPRI